MVLWQSQFHLRLFGGVFFLFVGCRFLVWLAFCGFYLLSVCFFLVITSYSCKTLSFWEIFSGRFTEAILLQMTTRWSLSFKNIIEVQSSWSQRYNFKISPHYLKTVLVSHHHGHVSLQIQSRQTHFILTLLTFQPFCHFGDWLLAMNS